LSEALAIAAQDTHAIMAERIFESGLNSDGTEIGVYDYQKPIYVDPKISPKNFPVTGKNGGSKFSDGKTHKTGYFESYQEYRKKIGRQTSRVDLTLSGLFKSDLSRAVVKISEFVYASKVSQQRSIDIMDGVKNKYGDVFSLSKNERENFIETLEYESLRIMKGA
jgi:hypothetical protein